MKKIKIKNYVSFFIGTDSSVYVGSAINNLFKIENGYLIQLKSGLTYYSSSIKNTDSEKEANTFAAGEEIVGW